MTRQTITFRLSLACSGPRTRHAPLKRHAWMLGRRLLPARFVVRHRDGYGLRKVRRAWSVLGLFTRKEARTR
jgi:hypothetical protein